MKALLAQLACRIGDIEGNTARAIDAIRTHPEVSIAVFPELYLSGYTYRNLDELARAPDGDELTSIAAYHLLLRGAQGDLELARLVDELTINETYFLRERGQLRVCHRACKGERAPGRPHGEERPRARDACGDPWREKEDAAADDVGDDDRGRVVRTEAALKCCLGRQARRQFVRSWRCTVYSPS